MDSRYQPQQIEEKWYKYWEEGGYFIPKIEKAKKPYVIVIPPPNVTGILHMGHALNNTLQDILIRFRRMQGFPTLWLPGTDHAGIATQNVVERELSKRGLKKEDLGRERFLEQLWKWKEKHGATIIKQLKRLGCSCDWTRERFTMDEKLSEAVKEVFVRLYEEGLIYQGDYIVNWCPRCQTALSDEEVEHREVEGKLYYIKYPLKSSPEGEKVEFLVIATTRPETMLGDTAIAVHPQDRRYKRLAGSKAILPLVNREIVIVEDRMVDPEFGTGAVKVTPYHDPDDFMLAQRHRIEGVLIMTPQGKMSENTGRYAGLDRFACRERVVEDLKKEGLLVKVEPYQHSVGHCYRCETVIEPYLSRQWFVRMKPLAKKGIEVVREGRIKFYPSRWKKVYLNWMENIRDWCISRQIWWGHRLPVYYCRRCQREGFEEAENKREEKGNKRGIIVARTRVERCPYCGSDEISQEEDVLDTWFSSWLWPFSTLGWPEKSEDLDYFYPTSTLVTAPEIIFFWVARMIMAGIKFMGEIPFRDVYIHGTIRDAKGRKMSKSLGNTIDPLQIINELGADALRFSLVFITATGQDVFLSREKFLVGRNFANKIWNASRYILAKTQGKEDLCLEKIPEDLELKERWILSRLHRTIEEVSRALEQYRFQEAESRVYDFFWHQFCDWYIELTKPSHQEITQKVLVYVLEKTMRLLHPFMPFISEEIWQRIKEGSQKKSIMLASWPKKEQR